MERCIKCNSRRWFVWRSECDTGHSSPTGLLGPAHAVYFATYEVVKQAMGGNEGDEHHPLAAGGLSSDLVITFARTSADLSLATSGACATIASDALINPFYGRIDSSG